MLTVMQSDSARPGSGQNIALAFAVSDVDAECARLRDPDGNLVYLRTLP